MYRTSQIRLAKTAGDIPELTDEKIRQLTNERRIDVKSRIEMLQTLAGYKWVGEAAHVMSPTRPSAPTEKQKVAMSLLGSMELAYSFDWIERPGKYYAWIQFALNQPMLDAFMDEKHAFGIIEEGAVYGYPVSSTLAFAGIIPAKRVKQKSVANYYLSGVNSEKYYDRETEYAEKIWYHLSELAPELIKEAFEDYQRSPAHIERQGNVGLIP